MTIKIHKRIFHAFCGLFVGIFFGGLLFGALMVLFFVFANSCYSFCDVELIGVFTWFARISGFIGFIYGLIINLD